MKLIGSLIEQNARAIMAITHDSLFKGHNPRLFNVLKTLFPELKTVYFLAHTPEQGEDIYVLLVDATHVVSVELDRYDENVEPIVRIRSLKEYKRKLSKTKQIELAVAMDLSQKDLSSSSS
ncbi:hypothetical protein [Methylomusa anaerophila]|uniref:Uncharacterized protein n=1 Tax=Methylomusa anaerophila TaxID=1930071 RepID=A0A348AHA0_9FIRM|nr:hypothetical protein [Methylomusa anaerophila]BBB90448.1 hypothetical protein MAMMFC1_01099 [Methylomusa anaerophila]BBB91914.1 hypothetical protein MAMMFC1_02599 [Methylomusa anaerophila]